MQKIIAVLLLSLLVFASWAQAGNEIGQLISPGELASPHAKYEGITNCTKCHKIRGGIPDSNCLDCHDKLAERIKQGKGAHAKLKDACIKCHADHKGRGFKMASLDENKFKHDQTGYALEGKHAKTDCAKCHKKKGSYAGLSVDCASCHKDAHKGQLDKDCSRCHNIEGWKDIKKFDHNRDSQYPLKGKHTDVKCEKCHASGKYKPIESKGCDSPGCHRDPHKTQFKGQVCAACHVAGGWKEKVFDHNGASYKGYRLEGKHLTTPCEKCHARGKYKPLDHKSCDTADCHPNPHKKQFTGKTCESCHTVRGWGEEKFEHNSPEYKGYKLEGKHLTTPCEKCHPKGRYKPIEYKTCDSSDCHKNPHKEQFKGQVCDSCHITDSWKKTLFEHNGAKYTGYRLEGKHLTTACDKCHVKGAYKPISYKTCDSPQCHGDEHKGQFKNQVCEVCHITDGWKKTLFDHNGAKYTGYRLDGKHLKTACDKCHINGKYKPIADTCATCHEKDDVHKNELGQVCKKCHNTADWKKTGLNHNLQTDYPLRGKHKDTKCEKCHKGEDKYKKYKIKKSKCADCHEDKHKGKYKEECQSCHTEASWDPRGFNHKQKTGYDLGGAHLDVVCARCHTVKDNFKQVTKVCAQCHVDPHFNQFGSAQCLNCHTQNSWNPTAFKHSLARFPLAGSHRAADCTECHLNRVYRNTSSACVSCHLSQYTAALDHVASGYSRDCTQCHSMQKLSWSYNHRNTVNCSRCHLNDRPASHAADPLKYPTTCENCHRYPSWTATTHPAAGANCSSCHLNQRPASHSADQIRYPATCENCHRYPSWNFTHPATGTNCSSCHLNQRPASHSADQIRYPATCENCHRYPSWTTTTHPATGANCASCHTAPPAHTTNNYGTNCEACHRYPSWVFNHSTASSNCASCHTGDAPQAHLTYSTSFGTNCGQCHRYPSWNPGTINHSALTSFPTSHKGYSACADCHPSYNYGEGNCIGCHNRTGADVHNTSSNPVCLNCHPTGR